MQREYPHRVPCMSSGGSPWCIESSLCSPLRALMSLLVPLLISFRAYQHQESGCQAQEAVTQA